MMEVMFVRFIFKKGVAVLYLCDRIDRFLPIFKFMRSGQLYSRKDRYRKRCLSRLTKLLLLQ